MRALIALVPIALVSAYVALADGSGSDQPEQQDVVGIPDAPAVVVAEVGPVVEIAVGTERSALAAAREARAAVELTLDGLLQIIASELEGDPAAGETTTVDFAVSAAILAELTAKLDGLVHVQVQDSDHVVLTASDGAAAVRLAIER
jgi:hypothetical protein